ncbi:MAG TPA: MFS transporter [Mycobacteriales bacterium]
MTAVSADTVEGVISGGRRPLALAALCGVLFLTFLDNTIVSVALGNIQPDLHAGVSSLQWIVNGYALAFATVMLPAGAISDEFGRKLVMMSGIALFCIGSVICAVAPDSATLIAGRVVMGFGAAGSEPGTLSMLRQLYPNEPKRARALGTWAAVSGLALALGPVIGGALVGVGSWRDIFWFNLALGVLLFAICVGVLPESADPAARRVDALGSILGMAAIATAVFGVIHGETVGFDNAVVLALWVIGFVLAVLFYLRMRFADHPLIDLRAVRSASFRVSTLSAFTTYFATFSVFFFTALYLQEVVGTSAYRVAVEFLPLLGGLVLASLVAGRWTGHLGPRVPLALGCLVFAGGLFWTDSTLSPHPSYGLLAASLAVVGVGIGLTVVPITDTALTSVDARHSGLAASATNTSRELGAVVGVAVLGAIVNSQLTSHLVASLKALHIPAQFNSLIITAVEQGGAPSAGGGGSGPTAALANSPIAKKVLQAAYNAFGDGLHIALSLSAWMLVATAIVAVVFLRNRRAGAR